MLQIVYDDITRLRVDAIVNAANESLLGGSGVDGAIHRAAGPELLEYCRGLNGCPTGQAKITPGFLLPADWVIHTVGPVWRNRGDEPVLLAEAYRNSLELAYEHAIRTIAFPAISTGAYGFPKPEAARIAMTQMRAYEADFDEIIACCFSEADKAVYRAALTKLT